MILIICTSVDIPPPPPPKKRRGRAGQQAPPVDLLAVKADLERRADELGKRLPKNPLDMLIDKLGPENVAEVIKTLKGMAAHEKYFNMSCFWLS